MKFFNPNTQKKWLAIAGSLWFAYLIFHMLSLLNYHQGEASFNGYFDWFTNTPVYWILLIALILALLYHVTIAISRQLSNHKAKGKGNKKSYPILIPHSVAWIGALSLLAFIIFHVGQMQFSHNLYQTVFEIFNNPVMMAIYALGLLALAAHLHHALTNVLQTFGISPKTHQIWAVGIVAILILGFISIPLSIHYA